ncbi:MAG TPA: hypothetical protein VFB77_07930 [Acidimicrobiales bacterium]|nr:hypothetical protein [Acidimicrobiales bacterium]
MSARLPRLVVPSLVVALAALGLLGAGRGGAAPAGEAGTGAEVVWSDAGAAVHGVREGSADQLRSPARVLAVVAAVAAAVLAGLGSRPVPLLPGPAPGGGPRGASPLRRRGPPRRAR